MIIHYHNRSKLNKEKEDGAIYHDNLKSLFSVSDVLSICCPATKETENMINKETVEYFEKFNETCKKFRKFRNRVSILGFS